MLLAPPDGTTHFLIQPTMFKNITDFPQKQINLNPTN